MACWFTNQGSNRYYSEDLMRTRLRLAALLTLALACFGCDEEGNFVLFDADAGDVDGGASSDTGASDSGSATTDTSGSTDDSGSTTTDTSGGPALCGDGVIGAGETCDDGAVPSCSDAGFDHGQTFCQDCQLITATCWNGTAASGEINPQEIVARHNIARLSVDPPASTPLPLLEWDQTLADFATGYTANCVWEHSSSGYGENLYAGTSGDNLSASAVDGWVSEVAAYDLASNSCSDVCGHYTQVVWADSLRVGCGVAYCPNPTGLPWAGYILSCNYDPPGNYVGQKPYDAR